MSSSRSKGMMLTAARSANRSKGMILIGAERGGQAPFAF